MYRKAINILRIFLHQVGSIYKRLYRAARSTEHKHMSHRLFMFPLNENHASLEKNTGLRSRYLVATHSWNHLTYTQFLCPRPEKMFIYGSSLCGHMYRVSQQECARLRKSVPYVKVYRYNPKHLYPKLNGYGDNGQRKVRSSCGSTYCTCSADALRVHCTCP